MSWKPSRSSGVMFDKYSQKSGQNYKAICQMIESGDYIRFDNLNKLSRHIYLYWLNENKKHCSLVSSSFNPAKPFYDLETCCIYTTVLKMLQRNKHLVYKPLQKYL